jgi:hypothetical protein
MSAVQWGLVSCWVFLVLAVVAEKYRRLRRRKATGRGDDR